MSTETEGLSLEGDDGISIDRPVDQTVTITDADVQRALDAVDADTMKDDNSFFGKTDVAMKAPDQFDVEANGITHTFTRVPEPVDPNLPWFSPEEFAKRVAETKNWVHGLRNVDSARSADVIRRVKQAVTEAIGNSSETPANWRQRRAKAEDEAMIKLRQKLNEINFTEDEALLAGNLLSGHATWKIWYENGEWKIVETKAGNPQTFVTSFRHAAAAMKMNNLLNMGKSSIDLEVLAVIGACKRLDDIISTLPEAERAEYNALMSFLNEMPNS